MRTSDFYDLFAAGTEGARRGVRRILHELCVQGSLVGRLAVEDRDTCVPGFENAYWLSLRGKALACSVGLSAQGDESLDSFSSPYSIAHELAITDFHWAVERHCDVNGWGLYWQQENLKRSVHPDALFAITDPKLPDEESTVYYFLEVERSRQGNYRRGQSGLVRKVRNYALLWGTDGCRAEWQWFDTFSLVVVVGNPMRRENLSNLLRGLFGELPWLRVLTADSELSDCLFDTTLFGG